MINFWKFITTLSLVAFLAALQNLISFRKRKQVYQFPLILISVLCSVVEAFYLLRIRYGLHYLLRVDVALKDTDLVVINAFLMFGFILVKLLLRPMIRNICNLVDWSKAKLPVRMYEYSQEYDGWFLRKKWKDFRGYCRGLVCGMVVFCGVYLWMTWITSIGNQVWMPIIPCAALTVMLEIYGYVNGSTKEEYESAFMGEDTSVQRISNYYKLRIVLEQLLPEPLLAAHTGSEFANRTACGEIFKELSSSESSEDKVAQAYFETDNRFAEADPDCVQATLGLMHRRNVVFFNPFYRDLSLYVTLPIVHSLLSGEKCVVICGRISTADDVQEWLSDLLSEYSHIKSMWKVNKLTEKTPDCEVGILSFPQIYDPRVLEANKKLMQETDFVLLLEPSLMLNTGQIALSILAERMGKDGKKPIYCVFDRNADGLVDTLSHLLHGEITDVVAPSVPRCDYSALTWDADGDFCRQQLFDKQTRYLGGGTELAAIAVKNQVPEAYWYGEKKVPLKDIRWIAGQFYSTICRYMNLPVQQESLYERIHFVSSLWSSEKTKEQFVIAEDEFCNMFSMLRSFLSRGENQLFVNIFSENYLLRDYMRCNKQLFLTNPNSIPSYVPDYAKTERNTLLKLLIRMSLEQVPEQEVIDEFHLIGREIDDVQSTLKSLIRKYTFADDSVISIKGVRTQPNEYVTVTSNLFSIDEESFDRYFSETLKNAYFILESEKKEEGYIDAKLFEHVTQIVLPGQFVTYDGKYYQVKHVSPQSGVVLRRAADQFDGRKYYRQSRTYTLDSLKKAELVSAKTVMDIEFVKLCTDFSVMTDGYLELKDNHNLRTARYIDLSQDPSVSHCSRKYRNKNILRIKLPETDDKLCFTFCLLLSEVFKSVFPDGWPYLAVVTRRPDDVEGILNYVVYPVEGDVEAGYIYIIEDSEIDLGLLDAVEKNFMRLMEIVADFLDWHYEKMREVPSEDPVPVKIEIAEREERKRRGLITRMLDRIRKLFGGKKEEEVNVDSVEKTEKTADKAGTKAEKKEESAQPEETVPEQEEKTEGSVQMPVKLDEIGADIDIDSENAEKEAETAAQEESPVPEHPVASLSRQDDVDQPEDRFEPDSEEDPDLVHVDGTDIFDNDGMPEDNDYLELSFQEAGLIPLTKSRYQRECYLKYGYEEIDDRIRVDELRRYLRVRGWSNNALTLARKRDAFEKRLIDLQAVNLCDFCDLPLTGVSYERLADGRLRCNNCSGTALETLDEVKEVFYRSLRLMEDFYGIQFKTGISVRVTDAKEIGNRTSAVFNPSKIIRTRVLGFAERKNDQYSLVVENGSPRLAFIDTAIHELTHIWQYMNWDDELVWGVYGMNRPDCSAVARDIVYEGMAVWASIQYLYQIGETYFAAQREAVMEARQDVYGEGFRIYRAQYPFVKDSSLLKVTPFMSFPTLQPAEVANAVKKNCRRKNCSC